MDFRRDEIEKISSIAISKTPEFWEYLIITLFK